MIGDMFKLFSKYYDGVHLEQFRSDLKNKKKVIVIRNKAGQICGFSTLTTFKITHNHREKLCIYSGDTIIDKSYWGTSALTIEFLKNIIAEKLKHPFTDVWWFLISKGYKTYLLMANNFHDYYPCYHKETPAAEAYLLKTLSNKVYPGHYNEKTGLITFEDQSHDKLKDYVAPITEQMCKENPKISFFNFKNPNWEQGDELACIGKVSLALGVTHPIRVLIKIIKKKFKRYKNVRTTR